MKRLVYQDMDIMCMAKLSEKYADHSITGDFGNFIYFSKAQHSVGPRVKFYGGGNNLSTKGLPSLEFNVNGVGKVIGDRKLYPNIDDEEYMTKVRGFVDKFRSLLLLIWYNWMEEDDLQHYLEGKLSWKRLMQSTGIPELTKCKNGNMEQLHKLCLQCGLYNFPNLRKRKN